LCLAVVVIRLRLGRKCVGYGGLARLRLFCRDRGFRLGRTDMREGYGGPAIALARVNRRRQDGGLRR
jgi:hypothetical protein